MGGMLDFDFMCKRKKPSVAAMVFPFSGNHYVKFYWGTEEVLLPVYTTTKEAVAKHPDVSVFINFASFRSVHETSMEAMTYPSIKTVPIFSFYKLRFLPICPRDVYGSNDVPQHKDGCDH